jgi:hypothetical protein
LTWARGHELLAAVAGVLLGYLAWRWYKGRNLLSAGHPTTFDAIADGWMVYPAGVTGWKETSPDGKSEVWHDTGWIDPFGSKG